MRLRVLLSGFVAAALLAGCSGASSTAPTASVPQIPAGAARSKLPHLRRLERTPLRPARKHRVTAAMRARARAGGWQELAASSPFANGADSQLLMTDGTILVHDYCTPNWFRLTPDKTGSYLNGTWSEAASMPSNYGPLYFASAVLADGKLIVNGGEYNFCVGDETTLGAIYDPVANSWTAVSPPSGWSYIGDGQSAVLSNGTYMLGNCCTYDQALLDESTMTWTQIGTGKEDQNSEEGWTLLRNGDVLTADVIEAPNSEVYSPANNDWTTAGSVGVNLTQSEEIGPQTMRPNNTVFVVGANGYTAVYNANTGVWTQGPNFPQANGEQLDVADGPSTLLTNGSVMVPGSPGVYQTPASFFIFNGKKFKSIANPPGAIDDSSYNIRLLVLPTGQILECDDSFDVEIYSNNSQPMKGLAPRITSVPTTLSRGSTYKISGKRFNGFSQANFYGDDDQQATNYPLVRIINSGSGNVYYARTHDHSYMGIGSNRNVSTMFDVPSGMPTGAGTLEVVTNGIASSPVSVTIQ